MKLNNLLILFILLTIISCGKDDDTSTGAYAKGVFILNQGKFPGGASAVSFIGSLDINDTDIYAKENANATLGPVAQGMIFKNDNAYISLNGDNKIVVVDANTFKNKSTITGVDLPRYFVSSGDKIYASQWGATGFDGSIKIIGSDNKIVDEIKTDRAPEKMLIANNKLYVTMSNGFAHDSFLRIYNLSSKALESELTLGSGPNSIVQDNTGSIWVLCGGYFDFVSGNVINSRLYKIVNDKVISYIQFDKSGIDNLTTNASRNKLYFTNGDKITEINPATNTQTDYSIPGVSAFWYGLGYSNNENALYASDAKDYASQGSVYRLDLDDNKVKEFKASVVPAQIYIRE
jgi:hypothetical protein